MSNAIEVYLLSGGIPVLRRGVAALVMVLGIGLVSVLEAAPPPVGPQVSLWTHSRLAAAALTGKSVHVVAFRSAWVPTQKGKPPVEDPHLGALTGLRWTQEQEVFRVEGTFRLVKSLQGKPPVLGQVSLSRPCRPRRGDVAYYRLASLMPRERSDAEAMFVIAHDADGELLDYDFIGPYAIAEERMLASALLWLQTLGTEKADRAELIKTGQAMAAGPEVLTVCIGLGLLQQQGALDAKSMIVAGRALPAEYLPSLLTELVREGTEADGLRHEVHTVIDGWIEGAAPERTERLLGAVAKLLMEKNPRAEALLRGDAPLMAVLAARQQAATGALAARYAAVLDLLSKDY